jgi:ribonuclease Y
MGAPVKKAKRAGLLHDIGKAVDQEAEGHHANLGSELCAKYGESADIVDAIRLHHASELDQASVLAVVLHTANAISGRRPGARKEVLESYIQRLQDMESVVKTFKGVDSAFVLQAGKEVRAVVNPSGLTDSDVSDLSVDIASKLRKELTFPGQVKVTVIRESRFVDFAK